MKTSMVPHCVSAPRYDEQTTEVFLAGGAHPSFGLGIGVRGAVGRLNNFDPL